MATETDTAEALDAAGQDADSSLGSDAPNGVLKCRQLDTEHELEEPRLLEVEAEIEPPEGASGGDTPESETGSEAGPETGSDPGSTEDPGASPEESA